MKKILFTIFLLSVCSLSGQAQGLKLTSSERDVLINRVKEYCGLLQSFSGDIEQIDKIEEIFAMCENDKVQTFDDLSDIKKTQNAEYNSFPLFQYLQNITSRYDNQLQVSYSDFKCEKTISESSMKTDMGIPDIVSIGGNSYALIHVVKKIRGKGINKTVPLKITINVSSRKIGGTVSEEYEDPYLTYLKGIEYVGNGEMGKAIECLNKSIGYKTYSGRYRAMTQLGILFIRQEKWQECIDILKKASEHDPVGGLVLGMVYIRPDIPFELRKSNEALRLLEKYSSVKDKEFPEFSFLASYALACIYMQGILFPPDFNKAEKYLLKILERYHPTDDIMYLCIANYLYGVILTNRNEYEQAIENFSFVIDNIGFSIALAKDARDEFKDIGYFAIAGIYNEMKNNEKRDEYIDKLKESSSIKNYKKIADLYKSAGDFDEAMKYYKMAAKNSNGDAADIMGLFYLPTKYVGDSFDQNDAWNVFINSPREDRNEKTSFEWTKIGAEKGNLNAAWRLALFYANTTSNGYKFNAVPLNKKEALKWCCSVADREAYNKQYYLQLLLFLIKGIDEGDKELLDYLHELMNANSPSAYHMAGIYYGYTENSENRDTVKAFEYIKKGAEHLFYPACSDLFYYYLHGLWTKKNTNAAYQIMKRLADKNIPDGWVGIGECEEDNGNFEKAKEMYFKAFDMQSVWAANCIGNLYYEGKYIEKDLEKAKWYFEQAVSFANEQQFNIHLIDHSLENIEKINKELASSGSIQIIDSYAEKLQSITDTSKSLEQRITDSEKALSELFDSRNAIVKTIGSNGGTVVLTEKAEDFLMRLCTLGHKIKLTVVNSKTNGDKKLIELTIKEEKVQ